MHCCHTAVTLGWHLKQMKLATVPRGGPWLPINIGFPRTTSYWHTLGVIMSRYKKWPGLGGPCIFSCDTPCTLPTDTSPGRAVHSESRAFFLFCSSEPSSAVLPFYLDFALAASTLRARLASLALALLGFSAGRNAGLNSSACQHGDAHDRIISFHGLSHSYMGLNKKKKPNK